MGLVIALVALLGQSAAQQGDLTLNGWAVLPGYSLEVASRGFAIPTAIAFVPEPGDAPGDPLYFVTELQGTIKVVTGERSVHTFATVPTFQGQTLELMGASQQGLAGLCLAPEQGYVFATFTYSDAGGVLRNNLVRFETVPGSFALAPSAVTEYPELFAAFQSSPAHQIGNCVVVGERLFVGVGDGGNAGAARDPNALLGKVLCLSLDARPCRDEQAGPGAYVYALGLRNPFGLAWAEDALFAVDNGVDIDRFLRVDAGQDYNWSGSDQSIASGADLVFVPAISPVQLGFIPAEASFASGQLAGRFAFAVFGPSGVNAGVVSVPYDFEGRRVPGPPSYALEHVGEGPQHMTGFAVGPDGLYAAPNLPGPDGQGYILKLAYAPERAHGTTIAPRGTLVRSAGLGLLNDYPCTSCHSIEGQGGGIGPSLDRFALNWRLTERLNSAAYAQQVAAVDALQEEPFRSYRAARQEVLAATGRERTRVWLGHFLHEPRFDNPAVQMPNLGLSEAEASAVRDELLRIFRLEATGGTPLETALSFAQRNQRALGLGASVGLLLGLALALLAGFGWRAWRRARPPSHAQGGRR